MSVVGFEVADIVSSELDTWRDERDVGMLSGISLRGRARVTVPLLLSGIFFGCVLGRCEGWVGFAVRECQNPQRWNLSLRFGPRV